MWIEGADVDLDAAADSGDVEARVRTLTEGGPFRLAGVEPLGRDRHRCRFTLVRAGVAAGYRHLIDLQHRLAGEFDIVAVVRHPTPTENPRSAA